MKALAIQALRTIGKGLGGLKEDERFGIALLTVIIVGVLIVALIAVPLVGLVLIGGIVAIAFTYFIIIPWLMSFSEEGF